MTPDNTRELIAKANQYFLNNADSGLAGPDLVHRLATALAALTTGQGIDAPSVREAIGEVLADMGAVIEGMPVASDLAALTEITDAAIRAAVSPPSRTAKRTGYETVGHAVGEHSQTIRATAAITTPQEEDARERLHAKCDCVPNLGPAHCHLCGNEKGEPVPWPECSAVRAAAPEPEWEWAVQVAGLNSSEPMYFEFPDPLAADHFIKNGALWYSPRPNGDPKTLVRRRKAGPWLPVGGDDE